MAAAVDLFVRTSSSTSPSSTRAVLEQAASHWRVAARLALRSHAANSLAELILKTADQGHTTYEDLLAAASDQIQVIALIIT